MLRYKLSNKCYTPLRRGMSDIRITKDGLKCFEWESVSHSYVETPVPTFLRKLRCSCKIDLGVTLGDIFSAVDAHEDLKLFLGGYSWCDVDAFHREAKRPTNKPSDLEYIEISSLFEFDNGFSLDVHGIGKQEHAMGNCSYAIDFTPVNELIHLQVRLKEKCPVMDAEYKAVGEAEVWYSLLDVLGEIYYEISFHGSPENRDEKSAELLQAVEEVKSGKAKLVPWESLSTSKPN